MKNYEVVYIFDTTVAEDRVQEKLTRYHELLTGDSKGQITATDVWGRRQLAFPIKKKNAGNYVVVQFSAEQETLPEFERLLKLDEELLRYIVVAHEGEPTAPMSIATREPRRDDEEGEEGDDE
ncbi:MAG TPA: 30S ribosomal protein S6 [Longimicrobiales bacterium]